jgi:hypothetical protein
MATKKKMLQAAAGAAGGEVHWRLRMCSAPTFTQATPPTPRRSPTGLTLLVKGGLVWIKI